MVAIHVLDQSFLVSSIKLKPVPDAHLLRTRSAALEPWTPSSSATRIRDPAACATCAPCRSVFAAAAGALLQILGATETKTRFRVCSQGERQSRGRIEVGV